jgi:tetratricopeptide (TPR) repeat protein
MEKSFFIVGKSPRGSVVSALPDKAGGRELSERILTALATANDSLERATAKLIRLAELAYGARRFDELKAIRDALQAIPFAPAQRAGNYYQAVLMMRAGELDRAASILAPISAPRALLTLGAIEEYRGNIAEAARLHFEAMRAGRNVDPFTFAGAAIKLATAQAIEGDHAGSLDAIQSLAPFIRAIATRHPAMHALWHNALAVELAEVGRRAEARAAVEVALASPIAHAYPEFQETAAEIRQAEAARVAVVVVAPPQEDGETTEARETLPIGSRGSPRRHHFTIQPNAHTLLNPRASPRAPPSLFGLLRL